LGIIETKKFWRIKKKANLETKDGMAAQIK
jgi:hypothetical protein